MTPYAGILRFTAILLAVLALNQSVLAERQPVLKQIKVPHDYYFREMYLPQVSSGPQSAAWSPDGQELVFTMQGSLWRQRIGETVATQLTAGPGYDHQPDWSPDGNSIVFTRYHEDAVELQLLDLVSGTVSAITSGGDVNLEPRWSPDGSRLAFVSTSGTGRFHVFTGSIADGKLAATPVVPERKSDVTRYYYSEYDHEISPAWSPDGRALLYVANPEAPYGSGSIWYHRLDDPSGPVLVRQEETTWRARPDIAPDGKRVIYSSYLGRQWHQLWIDTVEGKGEPFPLTYGSYDVASARWSPDGTRIAFTVNEGGNTALRILQIPGGRIDELRIDERRHLQPTGSVKISVTDERGKPSSARLSIVDADGRAHAPHASLVHADDGFDRTQRSGELRYFHVFGEAVIEMPQGDAQITAWRGLEANVQRREINIEADKEIRVELKSDHLDLPDEWRKWRSGDVHVHMNYGGIYRNTPAYLVRQAEAEDLDVVFNLIVNKEQRVPDIHYFSGSADKASSAHVVLQHSQEFHTSFWGHLGILGLSQHLLMPDYAAYPGTAAASLYPDNTTVAGMAHAQGALVGYVHPFLYPLPDPETDASLTNALPIDAALGNVDFYEVVGFADHRASADIWYRLLNCGFRISAAGGTDAMANYASLRGPVGMNRTYVHTDSWPADPGKRRDQWMKGLKAGKSIATNGPLVGLTVNGQGPGTAFEFTGETVVEYQGFLRSIVPVDALELVQNGKVIRSIGLTGDSTSVDFSGSIEVRESGWLVLRASSLLPHPDILDMYPYATSSPVYINIDGAGPRSDEDAGYFLAWIDRVKESAMAHEDYNSEDERASVIRNIEAARAVFLELSDHPR